LQFSLKYCRVGYLWILGARTTETRISEVGCPGKRALTSLLKMSRKIPTFQSASVGILFPPEAMELCWSRDITEQPKNKSTKTSEIFQF